MAILTKIQSMQVFLLQYVTFMLQHVKVDPADKVMYIRLKALGLAPGQALDEKILTTELREALLQGG